MRDGLVVDCHRAGCPWRKLQTSWRGENKLSTVVRIFVTQRDLHRPAVEVQMEADALTARLRPPKLKYKYDMR